MLVESERKRAAAERTEFIAAEHVREQARAPMIAEELELAREEMERRLAEAAKASEDAMLLRPVLSGSGSDRARA